MIDPGEMQTLLLSGGAPAAVDRAVALLAAGEVVALPTETVYGLAADAANPRAVARIFEAKSRPRTDPLIVHLPTLGWLEKAALLEGPAGDLARRLAVSFWPGPLTLILPLRPHAVAPAVTAGSAYVAVRMSAQPVFRAVIEKLNRPLAAPSANRFGRISPTTAAHVLAELPGRIPLILDGGPATHGVESTIVVPGNDGATLRILRHGPVTAEMLAPFAALSAAPADDAAAAAPGQMARHYAPGTPLTLVDFSALEQAAGTEDLTRTGFLGLRADRPPGPLVFARTEYLSRAGNLEEAASNLFAALRRLDESGLQRILAERIPTDGLGRALMERLSRAAQRTEPIARRGHF